MIYIREFNGAKRTSQLYSDERGYTVIGYYLSKEVRRDEFKLLDIATEFARTWVNDEQQY